jgi:2'-5' RNA ligase
MFTVSVLVFASMKSLDPVKFFFAVFPDQSAAARIVELAWRLCDTHRLRGIPHQKSRFHCSLYAFDDRDGARGDVVAKAKEAGGIVAASPFRVSFDGVMSFSGSKDDKPFVLVGEDGVIGLVRLHASLCTALRKLGFRPRGHSAFTPHVTLLYDSKCIATQPVEPISWTVDEIVLVLSHTGQTRYELLGRWKLSRDSSDQKDEMTKQITHAAAPRP